MPGQSTASTCIPGYMGYQQKFQSQYVSGKDVPAYKYEDFLQPSRPLMRGSQYRSLYRSTHCDNLKTKPRPSSYDSQSRVYLEKTRTQEIIQKRDEYEYENRPNNFWATSYNTQHTPFESRPRKRAEPIPEKGPAHILTGQDQPTSYQRSYGRMGDNPRDRYVHGDGKKVFSRRATTNDLFWGTNKGGDRLPGYSGFNPESTNNRQLIRNNVPYDRKDNISQIHNEHLPGYTGHLPESVNNEQGPAQSTEVKTALMLRGLNTGLVINSMRTQ